MAGSNSWVRYIQDNGNVGDVLTNTAASVIGFAAPVTVPGPQIQKGVRPRYAVYKSSDGLYVRKVIVGDATKFGTLQATWTIDDSGVTVTLNLSRKVQEKQRLSAPNDAILV